MKKIMMMCLVALLAVTGMRASDKMDLKRLAQGEFSASRISGIDPLAGTDQYAQISQDGKQIVQYSFKTGKKTGVLFDVDNTQGEKISSFDGYMMAPDGKRMLVRTNTQMIYRRDRKSVV